MALILVSDIEAYLGTTLDSADSAVYSSIIDAVSAWIEYYCDCSFSDDVYSERIHLYDGNFSLRNNFQYFYSVNAGVSTAMTIIAPSSIASIVISGDGNTLSLINSFTKTDIDISALNLTGVVSAINLIATWSATIDASIENDYAKTLYPGTYRANPDNSDIITLFAATERVNVSQIGRNLFQNPALGTEAIAIYRGGYVLPPTSGDNVPQDLKDATIRFCISAYNNRNVTTASGTLKSERVGDYSYTAFTASEETAGLSDLSINYLDVLNRYKYYSI